MFNAQPFCHIETTSKGGKQLGRGADDQKYNKRKHALSGIFDY